MDPASKQLLRQAVIRSASDPAYFLRFFLSAWFPSQLPPVHLGLLALATKKVSFLNEYEYAHDFLLNHFHYEPDARDTTATDPIPVFVLGADGKIKLNAPGAHVNEILPRGFSKTTLCKGICVYDVLTDSKMFVVYISASAEHAEAQVNDIKVQLESNALLRSAYGNQQATRADSEKWTAREIHLLNGAILVARGRGGQVRGLTHNGRRPNKIVLDDVEDEDSIATDNLREKTMRWFYGSVAPAGQIMEGARGETWAQEDLQIINLGTLLGPDCLVRSLTADADFRTIRFGTMVTETLPLWSYKISLAKYESMRANAKRTGRLAEFTREYDSAIRVSDDALFPEIFIYQPTLRSDLVAVAQACDPAISKKKTACDTAIVVAGRRASDGALWFLDEWGGVGKTPREIMDQFFEFHLKWNTTHNGFEAVQYQAALAPLLREEMARRQLFFHLTPIQQGSEDRKHARITGMLSPRYSNGYLRHLRPLAKLEGQLADWPNGKIDYPDAAAMALSLLGESAGLLMPGALDEEPTQDLGLELMPEVYNTVSNYIVRRSPEDLRRATRYPVSASTRSF